jgi:hypothetical protein
MGKGQGRQPDSGNPTVRDENGGPGKRDSWWNCEPNPQPKGRAWKPSAYKCARPGSIQTVAADKATIQQVQVLSCQLPDSDM